LSQRQKKSEEIKLVEEYADDVHDDDDRLHFVNAKRRKFFFFLHHNNKKMNVIEYVSLIKKVNNSITKICYEFIKKNEEEIYYLYNILSTEELREKKWFLFILLK
jgi:hypothetical protein